MNTAMHAPTASHRIAMLLLWLLTVTVIYYGSLYPFELRPLENPGHAITYLLGTTGEWDRAGDLISNILLYIPCGLFGMLALKGRLPAGIAILIATLVGTLISASVEFLQCYAEYRNPTFGDIYANAIGSAVGAGAGVFAQQHYRPAWLQPLLTHPRALLLLILWLGARLYPYVPTIDLHKYWWALKPLFIAPSLPPLDLFRYGVAWLFVAALIHACYGSQRWKFAFPLFAAAFFAAKVLITNLLVKPADLLGCLLALLLGLLFFAAARPRYLVLALLYLAAMLLVMLAPFSFSDLAWREYGWIPFKSLMHGSIAVNVQSFCEKTALYGGMIWLLARGGLSFVLATVLTTIVVFAASYSQIYLPGRSSEITDVVICVLIGITFTILPKPARTSRHE